MADDLYIASFLDKIPYLARKIFGNNHPQIDDIIAEGNVALVEAARTFNKEGKINLWAYARPRVKGSMINFVRKNNNILSGESSRKVNKIRQLKNKIGLTSTHKMSYKERKKIAYLSGFSELEVSQIDLVLSLKNESLTFEIERDIKDNNIHTEQEYANRESIKMGKQWLKEALETLPERDRDILIARRLRDPPVILSCLSDKYGVSKQRIKQIEDKAFDNLQNYLFENKDKGDYL